MTAKKTNKKAEKKTEKKKTFKKSVITIERQELEKTLKIALEVIEKKSNLPVLSHVLLSADGKHCTITANNLTIAWVKKIECKGDSVSRCIPTDVLYKEIRALNTAEEIKLTFNDKSVNVNRRCEILTMKADEFPALPKKQGKDIWVAGLSDACKRVIAAVAESNGQYAVSGVYLDFKNRVAVGTDGHRLHIDRMNVLGDAKPVIIPKLAARLIARHKPSEYDYVVKSVFTVKPSKKTELALDDHYTFEIYGEKFNVKVNKHKDYTEADITGPVNRAGRDTIYLYHESKESLMAKIEEQYLKFQRPVTVRVNGDTLLLPLCKGELHIQTVQGEFPKYTEVIPKNTPIKVKFSADEFLKVMEGALPISKENIKLTINGNIVVQSSNPDLGQYRWQIKAKTEGKKKGNLIVGFNARYLIDAIKSFSDGGTVIMALKEPMTPCVINSSAVVMPVRLGGGQ